jgi:hypothetical protein
VLIEVVASDVPHPQGTAAGRDLWAWCEAARSLGHDVRAWVWNASPVSPTTEVPRWAEYRPAGRATRWGTFVTAADARRAGFSPDPEAVVVADNVPSGAAAVVHPKSVVTVHYRALIDAWSVRRLRAWQVRTGFEELRLARRAGAVLAYSARVGRGLGRPTTPVPFTTPVPVSPLAPVEEPVAALLADWWWPPNRLALRRLLALWPEVRAAVPGARLLLGGRKFPSGLMGAMPGVELVGTVADSGDVLARAAVLAFPCPPSSGPKGKTLEALAHGLAVVTTAAGMEGITLVPGAQAMVAPPGRFAAALAAVLGDPEARARLGALGRQSVLAHHEPQAAVRARLAAFDAAFGPAR